MSGRNDIDIANIPLPYVALSLTWLDCITNLSIYAAEFTVFTSVQDFPTLDFSELQSEKTETP